MRRKYEIKEIIKVEPQNNFSLICTFSDGTLVLYELKEIVFGKGEMVVPLRKIKFFKKVFLEFGSPIWPNGFDVCADQIYIKGKKLTAKKLAIAK